MKYLLTPLITLLFIACGEGIGSSSGSPSVASPTIETNTTSTIGIDDVKNLKMALNNTGVVIKESFGDYVLQIITSKTLTESKEISQSTIAVYGTVNGNATESLLKINTYYKDSNISVAVFLDNNLVGQSRTFEVKDENSINFGEITIN